MARTWALIAGGIGLASAVVGLIQAFSFTHIPTVRCEYSDPERTPSNMAQCIRELASHDGDVVNLQFEMYIGEGGYASNEYSRPFARHQLPDAIQWTFSASEFASETPRSQSYRQDGAQREVIDDAAVEARFPGYLQLKPTMDAFPSGVIVEVPNARQTANPFSRVQFGFPPDTLEGPFQISTRQIDETVILDISPAPMTDSLGAEVRCANRDWPEIAKFLACPFF